MASTNKYLMVNVLIVYLCAGTRSFASAIHLNLDKDFKVDYQINSTNQTIDFVIEAKPWYTMGWVGLGLSNNTGDDVSKYSSDFFMGYVDLVVTFVGDYWLPPNAGNGSKIPQPDVRQDWWFLNVTDKLDVEANKYILKFAVRRRLNTTDAEQDYAITNSNMTLLWAYHNASVDLTQKHTATGSRTLNFFTEEGDSGTAHMRATGLLTFLLAVVTSTILKW